ncbi:putative helicase [Thiovulum sp. ES]|nr:putative helicase [Thiovulum sp. ES]
MKIEFTKEIQEALKFGTERSLYPPLINILKSKFDSDISVLAEEKAKKGVGFPDITVRDSDFIIGYIEVKLPKDDISDKKFVEQFSRYKNSLENIIFTNLKVWELWQWDSESKSKKVLQIETSDFSNLGEIFDIFQNFKIRQATSSQQLAVNLAKKTQILANILNSLLEDGNSQLFETKADFKKALLHDIKDSSFANLIAETFSYSLFIASLEHFGNSGDLTLENANRYIPENIPVLKDLYKLAISLAGEIPNISKIVGLILKELNLADIEKIKNSFYIDGEKDAILNFYEPFLNAYDKETKKERGVFYTPKPVVDFIVKSTNSLLENEFSLKDGFLNSSVKILDPATGTGTFLVSVIEHIKHQIDKKYKNLGLEVEKFSDEVREHILKNFFGFELMIASYSVAHLKLSILLKSMGFEQKSRFQIYLANTLDDPNLEPNSLFGFFNLTKEGKIAKEIKNRKDIIAIIGNPPYSGTSQNPSKEGKKFTWIGERIEKYKFNGSKKLDEKNPKWLQDDYVKFISFGQFQIEQKGSGVVSYIVPHGFLDNPTFRYFRKSLLDSFDKIYILDLHGNGNKKEKTPDGEKDENVFDIKQGVTLAFFVKTSSKKECQVFHGDIFGLRKEKFSTLENGDFRELCKTELFPKDDMFYFIPRNSELEEDYDQFWSVKDIFKVQNTGIITKRDKLVIDDNKETLLNRIKDFIDLEYTVDKVCKKYDLPIQDKDKWKAEKVISNLRELDNLEEFISNIDYRPFDKRKIFYENNVVARKVFDVMQHMLKENIALLIGRAGNVTGSKTWDIVFISNSIVDLNMFRRGGEVVFPLYTYQKSENSLFDEETKVTNFSKEFKKFKNKNLSQFSDETIFYFIYGLLHSPKYREKYSEFLKTDFPKIDFSQNIEKISKLGKELADLHLLKSDIFDAPEDWNFTKVGKSLEINFTKKADMFKEEKIYLNPETYISEISDEVWHFQIGGYQVLEKWLNDRKNQTLKTDELLYFMKIIVSLSETLKIMKRL